MKKKILITLVALIILAGAALTFIIMKANDVIAFYKPKIEDTLSATLGARVILGELTVSLFPSLGVNVASVSLTNEQGERLPVSLGGLRAEAALMPLLSKRLELSTIELVRPAVTLQKTASGVAIPGLSLKSQAPASGVPLAAPATGATPSAPATQAGLAVNIEEIAVRDGELLIDDKVAGRTLSINAIQLAAAIALRGPETVIPESTLRFTVRGAAPVSVVAKQVSFNQESSQLSLGLLVVTTDAGTISAQGELNSKSSSGALDLSSKGLNLTKIAALLSPLAPIPSTLGLAGDLAFKVSVRNPTSALPQLAGTVTLSSVNIAQATSTVVSNLGGTISLTGSPSDLNAKSDALTLTYQQAPLALTFNAQVTPASLTVRGLNVKGFGGTTDLSSTVSLTGTKPYSADLSASALSIEDLLKSFKPELRQYATGTVSSFKLQPKGQLTGDIPASTQAPGSLRVTNAILKGTNLPNVILTKIDSIPFLEGSLRQFVPREFERYLTNPDTTVKEFTAAFTIQGRAVTIPSLALTSDIFSLDGNGSIAADGSLSMNTTIFFTAEFSQALTQRNKNMKNILAADGRLIIPLSIRGKAPALVAYPDVAKIIQTGAAKALQDKAVSALEKALDKGGKKNGLGKALGKTFGF